MASVTPRGEPTTEQGGANVKIDKILGHVMTGIGANEGAIRDLVRQAKTDAPLVRDTFWARQGE